MTIEPNFMNVILHLRHLKIIHTTPANKQISFSEKTILAQNFPYVGWILDLC